ncbi:MAG: C69 family dipeptidase [Candidatus Dormiibacterota bacterium]
MCDTVAVVGDSGVLFGKNSDRDPNEAQILEWHAPRTHPPGASVQCTWLQIRQVRETNATVISRPFWMWGAEMGANEHGVVIGNEAVFTHQPYAAMGLTGMDLLRLALERASTAAGAVEVMIALLEQHGQGGGCGHEDRDFTYHNSFLVADPREAWVLETAGRLWATEHVQRGVRTISNGLTIPGFAEQHSDSLRTAVAAADHRRRQTAKVLAGASTAGDVIDALRSHGEGDWPHYALHNGDMSGPCMHAGGLLAASQTTASWVSELRTRNALHWVTGTAAPCTSIYKPVRVDRPVDLGPAPNDHFDDRTLWWRHERLHRTAMFDPPVTVPQFAAQRDAVEHRWLADPPKSQDAFREADGLLDQWTAAVSSQRPRDRRPMWVRRYWRERAERAGLPNVDTPTATHRRVA